MELSVYGVEKLAAMRLDELRAEGRRVALLEAVRRPRSRMVSGLGAALTRVGRWLAPGEADRGREGRGATGALR